MPVNKHIGKLWFKTQEEIDTYDDLMVANIRLKDNKDWDSPTFSILASRDNKERFFEWTDKALASFKKIEDYKKIQKVQYHSFQNDYFYEIQKYPLKFFFGYLVLRELPIRRFHARCIIMFFFINNFSSTIGISPFCNNKFLISLKENDFLNQYLC